jgi:hypothetical protein
MTRIDLLRKNYQRICGLPWDRNVAGPQRVWLAVYDKEDERKLRLRMGLFEEATDHAGHHWSRLDLTDAFANRRCGPENAGYAEGYFESPELLDDGVLADFKASLVRQITKTLDGLEKAEDAVLAISGVASLFGFLRISEVLPLVEGHIRGRLVVFFPGVYEQDNYRLLDARDGWNYHAVPITASEGEIRR